MKRTTKRLSLPPQFSIESYHPERLSKMTDWDWAFQFAIRRSCWSAVKSLTTVELDARDTRNYQERRDDINRRYRTDKAIEMLLCHPVTSWNSLKKYGLGEHHFWHLAYLLDNTESVSPAISIPTLGDLEGLVSRARYIAAYEPERLVVNLTDAETGEEIRGTLDPDYVEVDTFFDSPLLLCIKAGNTPAALIKEFELFIEDHMLRSRKERQNPNELNTSKLAELYILAYIDLKIWTAYEHKDFYGATDMAWIIGAVDISDNTIAKRIAPLADQLLDKDSRQSQELLARAAMQRHAEKLSKRPAKRGRRPKTK